MSIPVHAPSLQLLDGEVLIASGGPQAAWRTSLKVGTALLFCVMLVGLPFLPLVPWIANRTADMHAWWVTDRRLVVRTGLIGWTVRSIPLDRIVDVAVTASWFDRLFGITHLRVRDMTGEASSNGVSAGVALMAVEEAEATKQLLIEMTPSASVGGSDMSKVVSLLEALVAKAA